jgi:glycosyltransferase involved in cell wall biosynthesis
LTAALREHRGRRVLLHHNITPPEFFLPYDPEMVRICALGREQITTLRGHVELALGDSEFNRAELEAAGFERTGVLPIYLDFARYRETPSPVLRRLLDDGRTNLLFVGRLAPNKRHDDLIRLASYWKRFVSEDVRLLLVGKLPRRREYFDALQALMYEEAFTPWEVVFTGHVGHDDLLACYAAAHVFVSMSEHEGFGVPLVESMLMDVPVLAYQSTAVPHTLGGAGVQFTKKCFAEVGEMAHALTGDKALRDAVLAGQRQRLKAFAPEAVEGALRGYLESL